MSTRWNAMLVTCLIGTACGAAGSSGPADPAAIPLIDAAAPAEFETATFALG